MRVECTAFYQSVVKIFDLVKTRLKYLPECVCELLGTNRSVGLCDKNTGQCPCLPNVVGLSCDRCKENHWKIASGEGCEPCDCDPVGSYSEQCNEVKKNNV